MQITPDDSYDKSKIAIVPMGFSYRDADAEGDDKPPRSKWDPPFLAGLPNVELTIFIALNTKNVIWKTPEKFRQTRAPCTGIHTKLPADAAGACLWIIRLTPLLPTLPYPHPKPEIVADFVDCDMVNQTFQRLTGLALIVEKRTTIEKHPVDLRRGIEVVFMQQIDHIKNNSSRNGAHIFGNFLECLLRQDLIIRNGRQIH